MATALTKPFANPFCRHPQKLPNQNLNRRWGTKSLAAGAAAALLSGSLVCPLSAEESFLDIIETSSQDLRRFTMENGLKVLIKPVREVPVVSIQIWVGTGSIHEDEYLGSGLSHYVEHMYFKGTETLTANEIWQKIGGPGGQMNAYTTLDRTVFYADMPASHWQQGLEVLADAARNASFPEEEWEKEKDVILREMAMGKDSPDRQLSYLLSRTALREHPMRHPVIGYEDVFKQRNREDLQAFFKRHYTSDNMTLVLVGDLDPEEGESMARKAFEDMPRQAREPVIIPGEPPQLTPRFGKQTGPYNITRVGFAWQAVPLTHPDAPVLDVLSAMLGSGRSSILNKALKEENPLCLSISAWCYTPASHGMFGVSASFEPAREKEVVEGIRRIIYNLQENQLTESQLEKAKRQFISEEISTLETINGQARSLAVGEFFVGDPNFSLSYLKSVNAVTLEDLRRVAAAYLKPEGETLAVLSPEEEKPAEVPTSGTSGLGAVQRLDTGMGFPLLVREDHRLPKVYISVVFGGGVLMETEETAGISQLLSGLLTRGTAGRTAAEIAEFVESRGGSLNGFSGNHSFGLNAACLSDDVNAFAELIGECLTQPSLEPSEVEKVRALQLGQIKSEEEKPFYQASQALRKQLFQGHPFTWPSLGKAESVTGVSRDTLLEFFKTLAVRPNMAVSVFGDITQEQALALVKKMFDGLPEGLLPKLHHPVENVELPARADQRLPNQQAILLIGYPGVSMADPRADALELIEQALSGLASDLGIEIREKRGLVYYVGAGQMLAADPGFFYFYAGTQEESLEDVESLIQEQVRRIQTEGLRDDEIDRARNQIKNSFFKTLQSNLAMAQNCAVYERLGLGYQKVLDTVERIDSVTRDQILLAAKEILRDDQKAVSIVRPVQE